MIYVALLRGINVGAGNKISMKKLKETFESLSHTDVATYINSGNVIFRATEKDKLGIALEIEQQIKKDFGLEIPVVVIDKTLLLAIERELPAKWTNNSEEKTDVMFLWKEVDSKSILKQLAVNNELETLMYVKGALLWNIPRKNYNKSKIGKIVGTPLYKKMSIRNCNTVRKLAALVKELK